MKSVPLYCGSRFGSRELRGQEVYNWLRRLDLTRHVDKFLSAGVEELNVVSQLGEEQLLMIGISDVHERLTLLHAIKLLQKPHKRTLPLKGKNRVTNCPPGDIELNVFKCRNNFYYNNNGYHGSSMAGDDQGDHAGNYTACLDLDRKKCSCESGHNHEEEEPSYEEVPEVPDLQCDIKSRFGGTGHQYQNNNWSREAVERVNSSLLLSLIKEKVIQDQVDLTRIDDESILRRIAGQYAEELAVYLGLPSIPATTASSRGGGGASFSSTSSSSSSGYVSSNPDLHPHVLNALRHLRATPSMWKVDNPQLLKRDSSEGGRSSSFIPGVYQPSSCLRNKDEIYDYVPPKTSPLSFAVSSSSPFEKDIHRPRAESLKLNVGRYVSFQRGAEQINDESGAATKYGFIRTTPRRSVGGGQQKATSLFSTSSSTFTISGGSCSSSTTSPSCTSTADAYGFVSSSPSSTSDLHSSKDNKIGGERVGETLLRIGRRLGLSRLLKTLRIAEVSQNPNSLRRVQSVPTSNTRGPSSSSPSGRHFNRELPTPIVSSQNEVNSLSDRLPSNERIIETINRLKLNELHKRKERIAHEHRSMLRDCTADENGSRVPGNEVCTGNSREVSSQMNVPCTPSANGVFQRSLRILQESPTESGKSGTLSSPSNDSHRHARSLMKISSVDSVEKHDKSLQPPENINSLMKNLKGNEQLVEFSALRELLKSNDLEEHCGLLEKEGFETLELFIEVEEEDLISLSIADPDHRARLLAVARSLRPSPHPRLPCQTPYQWDYYATSARKERGIVAVEVHSAARSSTATNPASNKNF